MQNIKEKRTAQGLITPGPAAMEGVQAGPQSSKSCYRNTSPVAYLAGEVDNATSFIETEISNPFGYSSKITRTPPPTDKRGAEQPYREITNIERRNLEILQSEEEKAFFELGSKLSIINAVASNAKNIHKPIRDNLICVMALYQQLREYREAIASNPNKLDGKANTQTESKFTQTERIVVNKIIRNVDQKDTDQPHSSNSTPAITVDNLEVRSKRSMSSSPKTNKISKRPKITTNLTDPDSNAAAKEDTSDSNENNWERVEHRKSRKKKPTNGKKYIKESGEALTIKTSDKKSYADMLKHMKSAINPTELGIEINEMRRTKTGELLIKLKQGEGQAEKLKQVLSNTLGDDVTIRSASKYITVDIRDMDESTEEREIVSALMSKTGVQEPTAFNILNIRESYGKTRQALVRIPINVASKVLSENRIKIGWIRCRIREKPKIVKCFRCLDQGHIGRECTGDDRSNICRRCCNTGHKSKDCDSEPRCIICENEGLRDIKHHIGSSICVSNRRNNTK